MNLDYTTTTMGPNSLRTLHVAIVNGEIITSTRSKEVLQFVKNRNPTRYEWKKFKQAIRLGETLKLTNDA